MKCLFLCSLFWMVTQHQSATAIKGTAAIDTTTVSTETALWPSIRWSLPPSPIRWPSIRFTLPPAIRFPTPPPSLRTLPPAVFPNIRTLPPGIRTTLPPNILSLPPAILRFTPPPTPILEVATPPPIINPRGVLEGDPVEAKIGAIATNVGLSTPLTLNTALMGSSHCGCDACTCCCVTSSCDCCGKCDTSTAFNANMNLQTLASPGATAPSPPTDLGLFASAAVQRGVAIG